MSVKANGKQRTGRPRGQPYIDVEGNGFWYVYWSDGRRSKRQSLGTKTETEAQTRFAQWILQGLANRDGDQPLSAEYTVEELWGVYDKRHVQVELMPAGRATVGYAWKNLLPHFGPLRFEQVGQQAVDEYVDRRRADEAAPATIRREIATLLAGLRFCASKKGGKLISAVDLDDIDLPPDSPPRDRWLDEAELGRLIAAAASMRRGGRLSRAERFLWLAIFTTSRKQALLELTWDRVDFEANVIHLNVPGRRLTKKRRADVSIATALRPVLLRAYGERTGDLVLDHGADDLWASLQYIAIRAGFSTQTVARGASPKATGVSPHVLRHSGATLMARKGVPLFLVAKTLGDGITTVERVYAKWAPGDPADSVDVIVNLKMEAAE